MSEELKMREIHGKLVYDSLREISEPRHTALLVIDMQNDFCTDGGHASRTPGRESRVVENRRMLPILIRFVGEAREAGVLPIWIKNTYLPDGRTESPAWLYHWLKVGIRLGDIPLTEEGTWGWEIVDELKPLPNEPTVRKYRTSAFHGTHLDILLRTNKIESIIVTGTVTRACVEKTATDAAMHDYYAVILRDCCAPYDETLVTSSWYDVATSEEVLEEWRTLRPTR